jgi:putative pyruvate formate lyase activating enzyme
MRGETRAEGSYLQLVASRELRSRVDTLSSMLASCTLCPRSCGVDRVRGQRGFCGIGSQAVVASYGKHFGEESVLVGRGGSGTIFMSGCNLKCMFCQNYTISCMHEGVEIEPRQLAEIMLALQRQGAENINWVTPTHVVPHLLEALGLAAERGLTLPVVYNSGGYESLSVLRLLAGIIDIYMPDAKFADASVARELADAPDYFERAQEAILEMHEQVGPLTMNDRGIATQGVLVRHLVLPAAQAGSTIWADALARILGSDGAVNVMGQYRPLHKASQHQVLNRRPTSEELLSAREAFSSRGFRLID